MGRAEVDLAVVAAALLPVLLRAAQLGVLAASLSPACLFEASWWACLVGVFANYAMHGFIWTQPKTFAALSAQAPLSALGGHPVDVFAGLEVVAKLVQGSSLLLFLGAAGRSAAWAALWAAPAWCWAVLVVAVAAGQTLNLAMYSAIGNAGVYYGFKLGREVPWASGFPFNVGLRHPQYVGVVLTLYGGLLVLLCEELAKIYFPQLVLVWAFMYVAMSAMEQVGDNDKTS
mmetsp:Transcript_107784/g.344087  ORF Transcript_107784/g.344087 Transcript_107784/m.344087 type:complete len:230 (-) Transcript_107784:24-713(-)